MRYINTVSWIGGNVAVHMRKVDNPECKVISLIVDADTESCIYVASLDIRVEISHFSDDVEVSLSSSSKVHIVNAE